MKHRFNFLTLLLVLFTIPAGIFARESKFTKRGSGPLFWNMYQYNFRYGTSMPEDVWKKNIDWLAEEFLPYGYDMAATDGWLFNLNSIDQYGYLTKYDSSWTYGLKYWGDYLKSKGMRFGFYFNPLWVPKAAYVQNNNIKGTSIPITDVVGTTKFEDHLYWIDTDKPGAEQWVKGCIRTMIDQGIELLKIDFLGYYERDYGTNRYIKALKWMAEEAGDEMLLSCSVPNCRNDARNEIIYADMIRISTDCDGGGWWFISDKERGQVNESGQGDKYRSAFDGLIGWADIIGVKGQTIMDPDFVQLNTLASDAEREFHISMLLVSGSPIGITDQYNTIGDCAKFYKNTEMLELNKLGFVGKPLSTSIWDKQNSSRWIGQLPDGDWIVGLFNRESTVLEYGIDFEKELGIKGGKVKNVRDLWLHQDLGAMSGRYSVRLEPHSCKVLRIKPNSKRYKAAVASLRNGAVINR